MMLRLQHVKAFFFIHYNHRQVPAKSVTDIDVERETRWKEKWIRFDRGEFFKVDQDDASRRSLHDLERSSINSYVKIDDCDAIVFRTITNHDKFVVFMKKKDDKVKMSTYTKSQVQEFEVVPQKYPLRKFRVRHSPDQSYVIHTMTSNFINHNHRR